VLDILKGVLVAGALVAPAAGATPTDAQVWAQCMEARASLEAWRANPDHRGKVQLVLGARTQEAARFQKASHPPAFAPKWIFVSIEAHDPSSEPHVQLDFNQPRHLGFLASALAGRVDAVLFDHSVVKFTEWTTIHFVFINKLMSGPGTFFLPLESWGALAFGIDPGNPNEPLNFQRPTGDRDHDARQFGRTIHLAMLKADAKRSEDGTLQPWLPGMLHVPMNWLTLDDATRAGALEFWKMTYLVPELEAGLKARAGFRTVVRVRFTPTFLKDNPECAGGVDYLACKR